MSDVKIKCTVRDSRFVEPCDTLEKATDNPMGSFSKAKGIVRWSITNMSTRQPSRTYFGIRTNEFKRGLAFNNCPFCGEKIDAPFADQFEREPE